ncbi:MAG: alkaline phosphatase family protein [Actinobacteria bacterium]|nr:alkaline phosphatase family protein [Actinomycetota bacterium]MBV9665701.1 alkaline phosphatase family protein [Actinomycetota bacterium]MBV9934908.1 alkaline phosphatase family protein [Actinomycetota bacterium]
MEAPPLAVPDYGGACLDGVVPALLDRAQREPPPWIPEVAAQAAQVVVLVLDGLGWGQLQERANLAPTLSSMTGGPITSVAPTTTATALASITTGHPPCEHGVVGYRVHVGEGQVMNVLRWTTPAGDARESVPPAEFQRIEPFEGQRVPAIIRGEFRTTGFTGAILRGTRFYGWRTTSTLVVEVGRLLREGEPLVYAYYDGVDRVAHEFGLGEYYDAELAATDELVAQVAAQLPPGAALVVTADHGQVHVGQSVITIDDDLLAETVLLSGEGRFRWLHARPGKAEWLATEAHARYGHLAWVRTRTELEDAGMFGGPLSAAAVARLGDVAIIPFEPVAFLDPADTGETLLVSRHGSLTAAELHVPLVALGA